MTRPPEDHTLQPTALVHEAWLRLVDQSRAEWRNRAHFLGVVAPAMRRVPVDHARARHRSKRGGDAERESLHAAIAAIEAGAVDLDLDLDVLARNDGLEALAQHGERAAQAVGLQIARVAREHPLRSLAIAAGREVGYDVADQLAEVDLDGLSLHFLGGPGAASPARGFGHARRRRPARQRRGSA